MSIKKNKYWEWSRYEKSLKLYPPLSQLAIFVASCTLITIVVGIFKQFLG